MVALAETAEGKAVEDAFKANGCGLVELVDFSSRVASA